MTRDARDRDVIADQAEVAAAFAAAGGRDASEFLHSMHQEGVTLAEIVGIKHEPASDRGTFPSLAAYVNGEDLVPAGDGNYMTQEQLEAERQALLGDRPETD